VRSADSAVSDLRRRIGILIAGSVLALAGLGSVPGVELMTASLVLRPPREEDAEDALAMLTDPEVMRWNPAGGVVDLESARAWCLRGADWTDGAHATWHAVDRSTGRLVANCSVFAIDREHSTAKIGYRVAPWHRRRGTGTEAVKAVASWSFAELGLVRLQLEHAVENVGSCRVASGAGFALEGTLRSAYLDSDGVRHDEHVHGRLADPASGSRVV
jgi:RimJ/RimL family protein N-acetyltransferase